MSSRRFLAKNINSEYSGPPNTFIGGVGASTVESEEEYAGLVNIVADSVWVFQVDGNNNVSFYIENYYNTRKSKTFFSDSNITYFIDLDGRLVIPTTSLAWNNFHNCANIEYLYLPSTVNFGFRGAQGGGTGLPSLKKIHVENFNPIVNSFGRSAFSVLSALKKLYLPSCTSIAPNISNSYTALQALSSLERLYIPNVTAFSGNKSGQMAKFFRPINSGCKVYHNSATMGVKDRNAFNLIYPTALEVGDIITINGLAYTGVNGAPATDGDYDCSSGTFSTHRTNLIDAINADTRTGSYSTVTAGSYGPQTTSNEIYLECAAIGVGGNAITVSFNMLGGGACTSYNTTFLGGNDVAAIFVNLREKRGCTLIECSTPITVNPPTSLSSSNQTANSVDLDFTEPIANANGTECFEVWVDDGTPYRYLFEYDEITASGDTLDLAEVVSDANGNGMTGLKLKVRTMDGQMNYSTFSNEITL